MNRTAGTLHYNSYKYDFVIPTLQPQIKNVFFTNGTDAEEWWWEQNAPYQWARYDAGVVYIPLTRYEAGSSHDGSQDAKDFDIKWHVADSWPTKSKKAFFTMSASQVNRLDHLKVIYQVGEQIRIYKAVRSDD